MIHTSRKRTSDPLLGRVDIHVDVPRVAYEKLTDQRFGEASELLPGAGARASAAGL